jgi:hypothetical protein
MVNAGTLAVNGSLDSSGQGVLVAAGATLGGTGTIGDVGVVGTLAPGNSVGALHTGVLQMSALSPRYAVEIDSGGADKTVASGTADLSSGLGGANLHLSLLGSYVHTPGTSYKIIHAAGGVSGTFAGLPEGATVFAAGRPFTIHYGADDVWLTARKGDPTLSTTTRLTPRNAIVDFARLRRGLSPRGIIGFNAYGPNDPTCSRPPVYSKRVLVDGNGVYHTRPFRPTRPGTYRFTAAFHPDANNRGVRSPCNAARESVTVPAA